MGCFYAIRCDGQHTEQRENAYTVNPSFEATDPLIDRALRTAYIARLGLFERLLDHG